MGTLRRTWRSLWRNPGLTVAAVSMLALGIGGNTAIFTVINAVLLRPLPLAEPDRLVVIHDTCAGNDEKTAYREIEAYRDQTGLFSGVEGYSTGFSNDAVTFGDRPELLSNVTTTRDYFQLLGIQAQLGRVPTRADVRPDGVTCCVVISDALWHRRFGGTSDVIGKQVSAPGITTTIIGVLPPGLDHLDPSMQSIDLWGNGDSRDSAFGLRDNRAIGRLKPGVSRQMAERALGQVAQELHQRFPDQYPEPEKWGVRIEPLESMVVRPVRPGLLVLAGAVGLVLLIVCANVSNLLLARTIAHRREIAIRTALGATRWHIARQLLGEGLVLALLGGISGLLLALWGIDLLLSLAPATLPRLHVIRVDGRVLGFTVAVCAATAVLSGLVPALRAGDTPAAEALKEGARTTTDRRGRLLDGLVVAELALAVTLLAAAGLLIRSLENVMGIDPGFDASNVLYYYVALPQEDPTTWCGTEEVLEARARFFERLLDRVEGLSFVESAGLYNILPLSGEKWTLLHEIDRGRVQVRAEVRGVSTEIFRTLRIPLLRGRLFEPSDRLGSPTVVVINKSMAERVWPGQDPAGHVLDRPQSCFSRPYTVVGVVGDIRSDGLDAPIQNTVYLANSQRPFYFSYIFVRTHADAKTVSAAIAREVQALDVRVPLSELKPLDDLVRDSQAPRRFAARLLQIFAGLALFLAALGNYGVAAYRVGRREREIGVRMALGARGADVIRLVTERGVRLLAIALAFGAAGTFVAGRWVSALLFGVRPLDPFTLGGAGLVLTLAALFGTYLPARRASRVDPTVALRSE